MAELFRVLLVTLLLCLFWLPSGLSEPDAEESAGASAKFKPLDPPMQGGNENGDRSVSKGGDGNGGNSGGPKKVYPSDEEGHVVPPGWPEKGSGGKTKGGDGFVPAGDDNAKGGGDKSKDGDPPGYCRCNTAGRHVQSVVLGLFLLTFGVCLTWIEL